MVAFEWIVLTFGLLMFFITLIIVLVAASVAKRTLKTIEKMRLIVDDDESEDECEEKNNIIGINNIIRINKYMAYQIGGGLMANTMEFFFDRALPDHLFENIKESKYINYLRVEQEDESRALYIRKNKLYTWDECLNEVINLVRTIFGDYLLECDFEGDMFNSDYMCNFVPDTQGETDDLERYRESMENLVDEHVVFNFNHNTKANRNPTLRPDPADIIRNIPAEDISLESEDYPYDFEDAIDINDQQSVEDDDK